MDYIYVIINIMSDIDQLLDNFSKDIKNSEYDDILLLGYDEVRRIIDFNKIFDGIEKIMEGYDADDADDSDIWILYKYNGYYIKYMASNYYGMQHKDTYLIYFKENVFFVKCDDYPKLLNERCPLYIVKRFFKKCGYDKKDYIEFISKIWN